MPTTTANQTRAVRARAVDNALASVRLEGLEPSAAAQAVFRRYVEGDLSAEEMGCAIDQLLDRDYGPVRLPAHVRS